MITFMPLNAEHFTLLQKWLITPHVQRWWPHDYGEQEWTLDDVAAKYRSYVDGYKIVDGVQKPIHAFIVCVDDTPIGYAQYYDVRDFPRGYAVDSLPAQCAALDLFIGEVDALGKGLGVAMINAFLKQHVALHFTACFVDPDIYNAAAIATFKKCGFNVVEQTIDESIVWMLKKLV